MSVVDDLLRVAAAEIGTAESPHGTNRQKYGSWFGWDGVSWCSEFVCWCLAQVGAGDLVLKTASVPNLLAAARAAGLVDHTPSPGALVCYDWGGDLRDGVPDHVGIVERVTGPYSFMAIEGNTSPDNRGSQSNGGGVYRRHRYTQLVAGFIHPPYLDLEADVPLSDAEWAKLKQMLDAQAQASGVAARDALLAVKYGQKADGSPHTLADVWAETLLGVNALRGASAGGAVLDASKVATAIVAQLGPSAAAALATAVRQAVVDVLHSAHAS